MIEPVENVSQIEDERSESHETRADVEIKWN